MDKLEYKKGDAVFVLCEVYDAGPNDEFCISLENSRWYINRKAVQIPELPHGDRWVPGEVKGYVIKDLNDDVLINLPYERIIGNNPLKVSKRLIRPCA